ncbi:MAG TPA: hypothetical protein VF077_05840 [Nitrospiraceae bacterium]
MNHVLDTRKNMGMTEQGYTIKGEGKVSDDCKPLALDLRTALLGMKDAFAGYITNEHQQRAIWETNRVLANTEGLK